MGSRRGVGTARGRRPARVLDQQIFGAGGSASSERSREADLSFTNLSSLGYEHPHGLSKGSRHRVPGEDWPARRAVEIPSQGSSGATGRQARRPTSKNSAPEAQEVRE